MKVSREELLTCLTSVAPGLGKVETEENNTCFNFSEEKLFTYNEHILASCKNPISGIVATVEARPLVELVTKIKDEYLDIQEKDYGDGKPKGLLIKTKGKRAQIVGKDPNDTDVSGVESPDDWSELPTDFSEAVNLVSSCVGNSDDEFHLTCVNVEPDGLSGSDTFQVGFYKIDVPIEESFLVRGEYLSKLVGFSINKISLTKRWAHFKNDFGSQYSFLRYQEDYPDVRKFLDVPEGLQQTTFPGGLEEIVNRAMIFAQEDPAGIRICVTLKDGTLEVKGEGRSGNIQERKKTVYEGDAISFYTDPRIFVKLTKTANEVFVGEKKLVVKSGAFQFVSAFRVA